MARCFVIGNGKSLNNMDLSKLKGETTIVANAFFHNPILSQWQPTYYCVIDHIHFSEKEFSERFFEQVTKTVTDTTFIFPQSMKEQIETISVLEQYKKYYVKFKFPISLRSLANRPLYSVDITRPLPGIESVSQIEIMVAMYFGYNPIYLIGMDHDWLSCPPDKKNNERSFNHFYQDQTTDNYAKLNPNVCLTYKTDLENILKLWKGYEHLRKFAEQKDIQIHNATNGGFLDVFERREYADLF